MKKTIFFVAEVIIKIYTVLCGLTVISILFFMICMLLNKWSEFPLKIMFEIFSTRILGGKRGGMVEFTADVVMFYKLYTVKNSGDTKMYDKTLCICVLGFVESLIIFFGLPLY